MARSRGLALKYHLHLALGVILTFGGVGLPCAPALGFDDRAGDHVIGSFRVGGEASSAANDAGVLFDQAMLDLGAGRVSIAQKGFERLIAADPDGALAARAREQLAGIYGAEFGRAQEAAPGPRKIERAQVTGEAPRSSEPHGARQPWVSPDLEMDFIEDAGDRVFFGAANAELGARARSVIAAQARWLRAKPSIRPVIEGYADDAPLNDDQNYALAEARAEAVKQRLIEEGVEGTRLSIAVYGRATRIAPCDGAACAAQNRRAVTALIPYSMRQSAARHVGTGPTQPMTWKSQRALAR